LFKKIDMNYKKKSLGWLLKRAQHYFNEYIRLRDMGKPCISCGSMDVRHASHFYSVKQYPWLRFNENNVHGSCVYCNTFLDGNLHEYRRFLPKRVGDGVLQELDDLAVRGKQVSMKWQRFEVIEILEKYKKFCAEIKKEKNLL
jgi:hypothetical protein